MVLIKIAYGTIPLVTVMISQNFTTSITIKYLIPIQVTSIKINKGMGMFNMVYEFNFCTGAVRC